MYLSGKKKMTNIWKLDLHFLLCCSELLAGFIFCSYNDLECTYDGYHACHLDWTEKCLKN